MEALGKLEKLAEYVRGAHHACNDENLSSVLHQVAHKIDDAVADLKVFAAKPVYSNGIRGMEIPVDTNPPRD